MANKNLKNFIKDHRIDKSLSSYSEELGKGDGLRMFNNEYKVLSPRGAKQVILQDEKDLMIAVPSNRLKFLLSKGIIQKLYKSNGKGGSTTTPQGFIANGNKITQRTQGQAEQVSGIRTKAQLGEVRGGRMKISENPSKWVHVQSGRSYADHDSEDQHHDLHHPDDLSNAHTFHRNIMQKTHPDDHEKLKNLINEYMGHDRAFQNMHLVNRHMTKQGQKAPSTFVDNAHSLNETSSKTWKEFADSYKASVKKNILKDS